jgi:hypothetical protein
MLYVYEVENETDYLEYYQGLIDTGTAWKLEGSIGREAMNLIEQGLCVLGKEGHTDYWGNYVPSRYEVEEGTKGSEQYATGLGHTVLS